MRYPLALTGLILATIFALSSCHGRRSSEQALGPAITASSATVASSATAANSATVATPAADDSGETPTSPPEDVCAVRIAAALAEPALPGARTLETNRLQVLTESKAEPVWFVDTPQYDAGEVPATVARYRKQLSETKYPVDVLARLQPVFAQAPKVGREVLLKDGYLFADDPALARALVNGITVEHLFAHDTIWIRRGETLMHAERRRGLYYYTDGPNAGDRVTLLLFDQLGHGDVPTRALARDFRALQSKLHFDEVNVLFASESQLVVDMTYDALKVRALLQSVGPHLELTCEDTDARTEAQLTAVREDSSQRFELVQHLRATMLQEIAEKLPFDEPRREWGLQLDGKLRQNWRHAYSLSRSSYAFNGDRYFVFDTQGRPIVPQVCVDFLTDTLERTSGTWWRAKGLPPGRNIGKLDFDTLTGIQRDELRRVPVFVDHARQHPEQFEVLDVAESDRVQLGAHDRFLTYLTSHRKDFRPGDIAVIRGPTPWDRRQQHYHSFFIYESDPVSGIPIALVGNAGRPTVRYWRVEAQRTPKRAIVHRLRPKTDWLKAIVDPCSPTAPVPVPLSPRGNPG